ncbi:MAG: AAA family ATPase [Holdemanella sp.]|nr:AAA family ATPase [Holdemanella sp.]
MRIGLYGLPTAGKTFILDKVKSLEVLAGSTLLKEIAPNFHDLSGNQKDEVRKQLAVFLKGKNDFIMDGHYSFGEEIVFTEADGDLYDAFLYLYVDPDILKERMKESTRNSKYLRNDIDEWQKFEIDSLRDYCHKHNKDFYVIDNPKEGFFSDINLVLDFIDEIVRGFSSFKTASNIVARIPEAAVISLIDGDRTYIKEDSSAHLGYKTHVFDGNFYTGFQSWRHHRELAEFLSQVDCSKKAKDVREFTINNRITGLLEGEPIILTTGIIDIWKMIGNIYGMSVFYGNELNADTKYFVAKLLQNRGCYVKAFGDSMNDYYMLKQADAAYLVLKSDGTVSSSLKNRELEGVTFV